MKKYYNAALFDPTNKHRQSLPDEIPGYPCVCKPREMSQHVWRADANLEPGTFTPACQTYAEYKRMMEIPYHKPIPGLTVNAYEPGKLIVRCAPNGDYKSDLFYIAEKQAKYSKPVNGFIMTYKKFAEFISDAKRTTTPAPDDTPDDYIIAPIEPKRAPVPVEWKRRNPPARKHGNIAKPAPAPQVETVTIEPPIAIPAPPVFYPAQKTEPAALPAFIALDRIGMYPGLDLARYEPVTRGYETIGLRRK